MKKKKTISIGKVFFNVPVALILIIIALLVLVPVIWMTFSAFKTERDSSCTERSASPKRWKCTISLARRKRIGSATSESFTTRRILS